MENPGKISIKEVKTPEELKQAQAIRVNVLEAEQGFPRDVNVDGLDESADHILILDDGVPVATARLTVTDSGEGKIARIAVLGSHRGVGLGKRLIRGLEGVAKATRSTHLARGASRASLAILSSLGLRENNRACHCRATSPARNGEEAVSENESSIEP